jgi:hypothetical protein
MISVFAANSPVLSVMAEPPIFRIIGFASFNYHAPLHEILNHSLKSITENGKKVCSPAGKNGATKSQKSHVAFLLPERAISSAE